MLHFISPALGGAGAISGLKTALMGGGPLAPILTGIGLAPRFIQEGRTNPTRNARLSILGSMGANLSSEPRTAPYYGPAYASTEALGLGTPGPSLRNYGPRYKERELAAGAAAEAFRPGAGFPGQQVRGGSPADRAYEQERSRVAQLTAQDPELQRYENARKAAQTQEEMNAVRDMGMEMWQSKYGSTPMGQPGGAIGTFNPLMQSTFGYQTGGAPGQLQAPLSPDVQTVMGDLGTRAMADTGYDPAAYGITPEMIEQIKKQSLERARK
jgi:hypothetical protein